MGLDININASRFFDILAVGAVLILLLGYQSGNQSTIEGGWQLAIVLIIAFIAYIAIRKRVWE